MRTAIAVDLASPGYERQIRRTLAVRLRGRDLRWNHLPDGPIVRIENIGADGMVTVVGYVGEFAPHLFTVVENTSKES